MAAAIPATNKWLLTKQASVALSGPRDDRRGEEWSRERRGVEAGGGGGGLNSGARLQHMVLPGPRRSPQSRDDPLVDGAGHTPRGAARRA